MAQTEAHRSGRKELNGKATETESWLGARACNHADCALTASTHASGSGIDSASTCSHTRSMLAVRPSRAYPGTQPARYLVAVAVPVHTREYPSVPVVPFHHSYTPDASDNAPREARASEQRALRVELLRICVARSLLARLLQVLALLDAARC